MRFLKIDHFRRLLRQRTFLGLLLATPLFASEVPFDKEVKPLLVNYCYDCHGDGMDKGGVALDGFKSHDEMLNDRATWLRVIKNLRADIMPPPKKDQPTPEEQEKIENWIKTAVFKIDMENPDPGRVTVRRLNRVEYRNTIRDLMGVDYNTTEEFPPDDTGYGFDNIGDVLTVSPLLLEKYLQAAEKIVTEAVPTVARVVGENTLSGRDFRTEDRKSNGESISFYDERKVADTVKIEKAGDYKLKVVLNVNGAFDFDPGRCELAFFIDGQEKFREQFKWEDNKRFEYNFDEKWEAGERRFAFELKPLVPEDQKKTHVNMRISSVQVLGPMAKEHWAKTKNYDRFFPREEMPESLEGKREYAREVLSKFATKAFRRPVDERMLERLVGLAEGSFKHENKTFEQGVAQAITAVLASPRFLFRIEEPKDAQKQFALLDEWSLASRLSYFLWSTMPDDELFELARKQELRKNLQQQVKRMLADDRAREFVENFTGQWLQLRDVQGIAINERAVFAREIDPAELPEDARERRRFLFRRRPKAELDGSLRRAMREETESFFAYIMREDRPLRELLDSDYTFVNERLAKHYGIEGVSGDQMRKVDLPKDSPRGGLITQGSMLVVSSNPTRTSPVKRGLFILDNILGSPPPPPPPDLPELEEAEKKFDHEPTLREALELHASDSLCRSCHNRMDPLGLGLENFNALGMWREMERGRTIDTTGKLITGEEFKGPKELKGVLATDRRIDFYRCLTEKMLTYALGRGLEYYDIQTVDSIVDELEKENGRFSALLMGIVNSAPFQKQRTPTAVAVAENEKANLLAKTEHEE